MRTIVTVVAVVGSLVATTQSCYAQCAKLTIGDPGFLDNKGNVTILVAVSNGSLAATNWLSSLTIAGTKYDVTKAALKSSCNGTQGQLVINTTGYMTGQKVDVSITVNLSGGGTVSQKATITLSSPCQGGGFVPPVEWQEIGDR
jgi:hypothetical protein